MTTKSVDPKIIAKIQKTLNLANAKSDEESQTAMLLAQQMMAKHNISMSEIDMYTDDGKGNEVIHMYATPETKIKWWQKTLSGIIADNFRCYSYLQSGRGKSRIVFLGEKEDAKIARHVFKFAEDAINYLSIKYLDERGAEGIKERSVIQNDYITGFLSGLNDQFADQVDKNDWGLVIVKPDSVVKARDDMNLSKASKSNVNRSYDSDALIKGYAEGKSTDTSGSNRLKD